MKGTINKLLFLPLFFLVISSGTASSSKNPFDAFGERLLGVLAAEPDLKNQNVVISPLSIAIALTATMFGSRGETHRQMRQVLLGNESDNQIITDTQLLGAFRYATQQLIRSTTKDDKMQLNIANAMVLAKGFHLLSDYSSSLREYLRSEVFELDFATQPQPSMERVNQWVAEKTSGRIPHFLSAPLDPETRLLLLNAVFFKAGWRFPFPSKRYERLEPFHCADGQVTKVAVMAKRFNGQLRIATSPELGQVLELPYEGGGQFAMYVHLPPDSNSTIAKYFGESFPELDSLHFRAGECVEVLLPKFKLEPEKELSLSGALIKLGMKDAFDEWSADLSGMNGLRDLFVSAVLHKTLVQVDEQGVEAAAVTMVKVVRHLSGRLGTPAPCANYFWVDRPFAFVIRYIGGNGDGGLKLNLFSGRVNRL